MSIAKQALHTLSLRSVTFAFRAGLIVLLGRILTPEEYGVYSLVATIGMFGVILAGLNLHAYVYRIVPGQPAQDQMRIFKATLLFEVCSTTTLVMLLLISQQLPAILALFNAEQYQAAFVLGLGLVILLVALTEVTQFLSGQARIEEANWVDCGAQALWVLPLLILWAVQVPFGLLTVLGAQVAGTASALAYAAVRIGPHEFSRSTPRWQTLREGIAFSVPMVLPALSLYSLKLADRFFLSHYQTLFDVGIYSFAYTLVNTLYTFTAWVIFNTFGPRIIAAHNTGDRDTRDVLQTYMVKAALGCFIVAGIALVIVAEPLIRLVARPEYVAAVRPLPLVSLSYVLIILTFPAHYILLMENRIGTLVTIDVLGMAVGIGGDVLLIPSMSYMGAALASAAGFAVIMLGKYTASNTLASLRTDLLFSLAEELRVVRRYYGQLRGSSIA